MKIKTVFLGFTLIVLIAAIFLGYARVMRPEIISIQPDDGASSISVTSQVRIEFSRPMDHASVANRIKIDPAQEGEYRWEENMLIFTPDQTWANGKEITVTLEEGARATNPLSFPMRGETWSFTTGAKFLVYLWPSDGPADIYGLNPDTGEIHQFTHEMDILEFTANKPGNKIFFSARNGRGGSDLYEIDLIEESNSTGSPYSPRKLLDCGLAQCRSPVVSYNGMDMAYERLTFNQEGDLGPAQVWQLDLLNLKDKPVGQVMNETVQPSWSSTGWLAFYDRTNQSYEVINPEAKVKTQLQNQTGQPGNWSPDGDYYLAPEIMYYPASGSSEIGISHLLRYEIQSGSSSDLSSANEVEDVEGVYSPDGKSIAFSRKYLDMEHWSLGRQIWVMNADGSESHPITDEPDYNHYDLAWSLDNLMLAYVRFNQAKLYEPPELWVIEADGSNAIQLVIGGYSPLWIP